MQRRFARVACGLAIVLGPLAGEACAADYPNRPLRFIVPVAPGGGVDSMARSIGRQLTERVGQQVVVDNRPGGGGSIGAEITAQSAPDGYTVLVTSSSFVVHSLLYPTRYDPVRDFSPITQIVQHPYVLVVNSSVPVSNPREFIAWAKSPNRNVNYASSGSGSLLHLSGELFNALTGTKMVHIPYKGLAQAFPDMFAGRVHATFSSILTALPLITGGRLRALGVTSLTRTPILPDTPTLHEAGIPNYEVTQWYGAFAPARTPAAVTSRLQSEIAWVLKQPDTETRIAAEGSRAVGNSSSEFAKMMAAESSRWRTVIQAARIRAE